MASSKPFKSKLKLVVAAIDLGTTHSGYAFAFSSDPSKISTNRCWLAGNLILLKTPTVLLLNPRGKFQAFGYEAENKYGELVYEGEHKDYYYFRRFKMKLYNSEHMKRDTEVVDIQGKRMNAIKVFSICIKYLMEHFMETIKNSCYGIEMSEVSWVLTVPRIWDDSGKQFMREAGEMAGIDKNSLIIALKPEAASSFCMHLPIQMNSSGLLLTTFSRGSKYMVVDVGGGPAEITVYEVVTGGLRELNWASGGAWGGTRVDAAFEEFIEKVFGKATFDIFKKECVGDWLDLQREFEIEKRSLSSDKQGKKSFFIPVALKEVYERLTKRNLEDAVKTNKEFAGKLTWVCGKLRVDYDVMRSLFKETCDNIVQYVRTLLHQKESAGTKTVVLVGEFSESPMLEEAFRNSFPDKRIFVPAEAGLAVLKGAVIFGHNPVTIVSRVARYTYGIRVFRDFVAGQHPEDKRQDIGGRMKCKDAFAKLVEKGQELKVGETQVSHNLVLPLEADQLSLIFDIYMSPEKDPQFVTDAGCVYLGQLEVDVSQDGRDQGVRLNMKFCGTEVIVEAVDERTNKILAKFNTFE